MNIVRARLLPKIAWVRPKTPRSNGLRAWNALAASWISVAELSSPQTMKRNRTYTASKRFKRVHCLFIPRAVFTEVILPRGRERIELRLAVFPVALHVPNLLV